MVTIRKASLSDIELIRSLACEIWMECYPEIISVAQIEYMLQLMYSEETIRAEINAGVLWNVIEVNSEPIGFLAFACDKQKAVKLNKLYVKAGQHGKGIGQKALQHVIAFAEQNGFTSVYLTVNKKNYKAIKTYERNGFVCTSQVVNQIGNGYVMDDYIYTYLIPQ